MYTDLKNQIRPIKKLIMNTMEDENICNEISGIQLVDQDEQNRIELYGIDNEDFTTASDKISMARHDESKVSLNTINIKNKGPTQLTEKNLINVIQSMELGSDTTDEISIATSDASIYEPLEKRLQKVYTSTSLNNITK